MEMSALRYHCPSSSSSLVLQSQPSVLLVQTLKLNSPNNNSWLGIKVRVQPRSLSVRYHVSVSQRLPIVSFSLPTSNSELVSPGIEIPKWSSKSTKAISMAALEARKLKYVTTGTESLLMGILIEGTNLAAKFLQAHGITLFKVRDESVKVIGKIDYFTIPPERPPMTDEAQRALDWAVDKKIKSVDGGEVTTAHIILGIWSGVDSPGYKILTNLGFNEEKAKELESLISKLGPTDD